MATYLITGIAGFIGSSLAHAVLAQGDKVRGVDNLATGNRENLNDIIERIDFREADILDLRAMKEACAGVDFASENTNPGRGAPEEAQSRRNLMGIFVFVGRA